MATADELSEAFDLVRQELEVSINRGRGHNQRLDEQVDRINALESAVNALARVAERVDRIDGRIGAMEARVDAALGRVTNFGTRHADAEEPPHDFGGVTSTGAPKTMTRWVITTAETGSRFSRW